ncbi:MAG: hypothetical protein GY934_01565 [Gammaproteobacteria bacterium]|nr:hypothetical protein [Gammaproteobacteria bacterium]
MKIRSADEIKKWVSHKWQQIKTRWSEASLHKPNVLALIALSLTSAILAVWLVFVLLPVILIMTAIGALVAAFNYQKIREQTFQRPPIDVVSEQVYQKRG